MSQKKITVSRDEVVEALAGRGLGDLVAGVTKRLGIRHCAGCERRRAALNKIRVPLKVK